MSSIEGSKTSDEACKFFREKLISAFHAILKRRGQLFPLSADNSESFYQDYPSDLPPLALLSDTLTEEVLEKLWTSKDLPEFAALAGDILKLAKTLIEKEGEKRDISPYIYEMY